MYVRPSTPPLHPSLCCAYELGDAPQPCARRRRHQGDGCQGTLVRAALKAFSRLLHFFWAASLATRDRYSSLLPLPIHKGRLLNPSSNL